MISLHQRIRVVPWLVSLVMTVIAVPLANAAGFVHNANFVVFSSRSADQVLSCAEQFRAQFALEWFGEELPAGEGRTVINVEYSETRNSGLTWAKDHPDRTLHTVFLTTDEQNATGGTLRHEIAHTVLATRYPHPHRLPPWLEEGIASRYDDPADIARREQIIRTWANSREAPNLAPILASPSISTYDDTAYAASTSLVSFLLWRGGAEGISRHGSVAGGGLEARQRLLSFAADGRSVGWERALASHYGIRDLRELQLQWESWLRRP